MNPYDEFIRDVWWLMQAVRKEHLAILRDIEFSLDAGKENAPSVPAQRNLLRRLQGWQLLEFEPRIEHGNLDRPTHFLLTIDGKRFRDMYTIFENSIKLGIPNAELYELANRWVRPMSYNDPLQHKAWDIMKGYIKVPKPANRKITSAEPYFKLPQGTKWEDIEIKFKNPFEVEVLVNGKFIKSATYTDLCMYRSRTKEQTSDKQWQFLHLLSVAYTVSAQQKMSTPPAKMSDFKKAFETTKDEPIMTAKKKLSQNLQSIFGIKSDPFDDYKNLGYYRTKFKLVAEPELRHDRLFEAGTSYNDERLYDEIEQEKGDVM